MRVSFKYESFPNLCYGCGQLEHSLVDCLEPEAEVWRASNTIRYSSDLRGEARHLMLAREFSSTSNRSNLRGMGSASSSRLDSPQHASPPMVARGSKQMSRGDDSSPPATFTVMAVKEKVTTQISTAAARESLITRGESRNHRAVRELNPGLLTLLTPTSPILRSVIF